MQVLIFNQPLYHFLFCNCLKYANVCMFLHFTLLFTVFASWSRKCSQLKIFSGRIFLVFFYYTVPNVVNLYLLWVTAKMSQIKVETFSGAFYLLKWNQSTWQVVGCTRKVRDRNELYTTITTRFIIICPFTLMNQLTL